jgi:hypothetical protein
MQTFGILKKYTSLTGQTKVMFRWRKQQLGLTLIHRIHIWHIRTGRIYGIGI